MATVADYLAGSGSANLFQGSAGGTNTFTGGGTDLVDLSASPSGVTVNLTSGLGSSGDAASDSFAGITSVNGSGMAGTWRVLISWVAVTPII